jgi:type IV secretory pathway VirB2 component (pilin)
VDAPVVISSSTLFASLYTALITPLLAQLQAMIGTVISTMAPIATVMAVIAVAVRGAEVAFGQKTLSGFKRDVDCSYRRRARYEHVLHPIY